MKSIFVTGATGFLAGWTIRRLLEKGYTVRASVRSEKKGQGVRDMLAAEGVATECLSFAYTDLTKAEGWDEAMRGMDAVLHLASPLGGDNHENPQLIEIARQGVEYVLSAAIRVQVPKVVMTSTTGTCYPDDKKVAQELDESYWTNLDNKTITNYMRSKIVAEKTAWDLIGQQDKTQLVTILPGAIMGPNMAGKRSSTDQIFEMILGSMPSSKVLYPVVDVRDLADLHILAMENEQANGERFIAESEEMTMSDMAKLLKKHYPDRKIRLLTIPNFVIGIMAKFQAPMKVLNTMVGVNYRHNKEKATKLLGWQPRPAKETVLDTAAFLVDQHLV